MLLKIFSMSATIKAGFAPVANPHYILVPHFRIHFFSFLGCTNNIRQSWNLSIHWKKSFLKGVNALIICFTSRLPQLFRKNHAPSP